MDRVDKKLSKRMKAVADMVKSCGHPGMRVADIGCDHAFISIYLLQHGVADKVIAADVNPGPLEAARSNVERFVSNMSCVGKTQDIAEKESCKDESGEKVIDIRLSNGFEKINKGETDAAVIAGMGGKLIISIIAAADVWVPGYKLILSPQSDVPEVREYLVGNGFRIIDENMISDEGKYYNILCAEYFGDCTQNEKLPCKSLKYGEILMQKKNPVFIESLEKRKAALETICRNLSEPCSELAAKRRDEVCTELDEISAVLKRMNREIV